MFCRRRIAAGLAALGVGIVPATGSVRGDDHEHEHTHRHAHSEPRTTQATPHTHRQAGYPLCISPLARPSYNEHHSGGYVGGGQPIHGEGRCPDEGTFGWDYTPHRPTSSRIFLNWSHGRRDQGGPGRYAPDGPKPLEKLSEAVHGHLGHD